MCKHFDGDVGASAVDVTQGREVLPTNVKPLHYHLTLEPNLKTFEYKGKVVIEYVFMNSRSRCGDIAKMANMAQS
jgi:aminopeptidase 2